MIKYSFMSSSEMIHFVLQNESETSIQKMGTPITVYKQCKTSYKILINV